MRKRTLRDIERRVAEETTWQKRRSHERNRRCVKPRCVTSRGEWRRKPPTELQGEERQRGRNHEPNVRWCPCRGGESSILNTIASKTSKTHTTCGARAHARYKKQDQGTAPDERMHSRCAGSRRGTQIQSRRQQKQCDIERGMGLRSGQSIGRRKRKRRTAVDRELEWQI